MNRVYTNKDLHYYIAVVTTNTKLNFRVEQCRICEKFGVLNVIYRTAALKTTALHAIHFTCYRVIQQIKQ